MTSTTWGSLHTAVLPPNNRTHHRKTNPMRSKNGNTNSSAINEEEEESDEEYIAKKDGTSNSKDLKSNNRANANRSKHSVTEQRRRCKINERFQILRDLMPHGDHKKDTASFLSEVIEHVQLLQEKVQKYEGSYQAWSAEPTKLMAWASLEPDANQDVYRALSDPELELAEKVPAFPSPFQVQTPLPVHTDDMFSPPQGMASDLQSTDCPITSDNRQDEHTIEGGTINISSTYSQELLATLTPALHNSGLDLSKARISMQIDLGKQANHALASDIFHDKEHENASCNLGVAYHREGIVEELLDQARD